jgi:hypothetical protein
VPTKEDGLRELTAIKLDWAKKEMEKGLGVIENQQQQLEENKIKLGKLSAVIDVLTDLLEKSTEPKEE